MAFAVLVLAAAIDVRGLFHSLALSAAVLSRSRETGTNRVSTLHGFCVLHFFPPRFELRPGDPGCNSRDWDKKVLSHLKQSFVLPARVLPLGQLRLADQFIEPRAVMNHGLGQTLAALQSARAEKYRGARLRLGWGRSFSLFGLGRLCSYLLSEILRPTALVERQWPGVAMTHAEGKAVGMEYSANCRLGVASRARPSRQKYGRTSSEATRCCFDCRKLSVASGPD
jgi:hypothetical protein